jgi:hypothetical protein
MIERLPAPRRVTLASLAFVAAFVIAPTQLSANLVVNGGFENGKTGWSFSTPGTGVFAVEYGQFADSTIAYGGNYALWIGNSQPADSISQTIATTAGTSYTFDFYLRHIQQGGPCEFIAQWGDTAILSLGDQFKNDTDFAWQEYQYTVSATGSSTTITFEGYDGPSWYVLDDVSVEVYTPNDGSATVPEPSTLAILLGLGGFGIVGSWQKRRIA